MGRGFSDSSDSGDDSILSNLQVLRTLPGAWTPGGAIIPLAVVETCPPRGEPAVQVSGRLLWRHSRHAQYRKPRGWQLSGVRSAVTEKFGSSGEVDRRLTAMAGRRSYWKGGTNSHACLSKLTAAAVATAVRGCARCLVKLLLFCEVRMGCSVSGVWYHPSSNNLTASCTGFSSLNPDAHRFDRSGSMRSRSSASVSRVLGAKADRCIPSVAEYLLVSNIQDKKQSRVTGQKRDDRMQQV